MDTEIKSILEKSRTVAVVGLSDKPYRPSQGVALYLQEHGFRIIPVNPNIKEALGEKSYASLKDISEPIDVVDIFRKSEAVGPIVDDAIEVGAKAIWMQEGVVNEEAAQKAREAGLSVVMNKCMMKEHKKFFRLVQSEEDKG